MRKPDAEEHFHTLFEYAPISLWEEDYSQLKVLFQELREQGVRSLESYLDEHPEFVDECMGQIVVVEINEHTLSLYKAHSKAELLDNLDKIFRDGMRHHFRAELLSLWDGALNWSGEGVNYTLGGDPLDIILHWRILPGFEQTWERVLVSIEDITERKKSRAPIQELVRAIPDIPVGRRLQRFEKILR